MIHLPKNDITRANIIKGKLYLTKKSWSRKIDYDSVYEFFSLLGLGLKFILFHFSLGYLKDLFDFVFLGGLLEKSVFQ